MHWAEKLADEVIEKYPNATTYVCASGISPSGSVHIGNFREVATSYFVVEALRKKGKNVRFIFSWDDLDRLRKVPINVSKDVENFEQYIGTPYTMCPDPYNDGHDSYATHFEKEFEDALHKLRVDCEPIYQTKNYVSGKYNDQIVHSIKERKKAYDILMSFKTQESSDEDRENYYPLNVYCSKCHKDTTKVLSCSEDGEQIEYECACSNHETVGVREYPYIKLVWKLDWPMRWVYEGTNFEPGGIDHAAASGSYVVCSEIVKQIFGGQAPHFQGYGWLGIKGMGDMHSSSGKNVTPGHVMKIYEPEMIRWLFAKYSPEDSFDFAFDDTIIRHYSEFDKGLVAYKNGELSEYESSVYDMALFDGKDTKVKVPFGVLASVAPIVDFKPEMVKEVMKKLGYDFTDDNLERLERVKNWIEIYQPQKMYKLLSEKNQAYYDQLSDEEKLVIKKLHDYIESKESINDKEIQQYLYDTINDPNLSKKENMAKQMANFKNLYNLLFGLNEGPRLYLYFAAGNKKVYNELLNF